MTIPESNTGDTLIRITADEAVAALTAAAHKVTDGSSPDWGRTLIHGIVAGHGIGAGMRFRWDLHNAIHEVRQASGIAWTQDPSGHELTIYDGQDRPLTRFDVKRRDQDAARWRHVEPILTHAQEKGCPYLDVDDLVDAVQDAETGADDAPVRHDASTPEATP